MTITEKETLKINPYPHLTTLVYWAMRIRNFELNKLTLLSIITSVLLNSISLIVHNFLIYVIAYDKK